MSVAPKVRELQLLLELSQLLDQSLDLRQVIGPAVGLIATHMGMTRASVALLSRETGEIVTHAAHGLSAAEMKRGVYRVGEGVTGMVLKTGEARVVPRVADD